MRHLVQVGFVLLALYLVVLALLFALQRKLLFPGSPMRATAAEAGLAGFEDVVLATPDGERLVAWWKPPEPGRTVLVYFHGNGGSLWDRRFRAPALTEPGRGLLMVSYRGYSGSTGQPSEANLRADARTTYEWLARFYEPARIVLYGESLGTGIAVRLATEKPVGGVILDAPYTSTADIAAAIYWFAPVSLLMRDQFRSADIIPNLRSPLLVLHGDRDMVIPIAFGERLFARAPEPKQFVRLPGAGHSDVLEHGGLAPTDEFLGRIEAGLAPGGAGGPRALEPAQP